MSSTVVQLSKGRTPDYTTATGRSFSCCSCGCCRLFSVWFIREVRSVIIAFMRMISSVISDNADVSLMSLCCADVLQSSQTHPIYSNVLKKGLRSFSGKAMQLRWHLALHTSQTNVFVSSIICRAHCRHTDFTSISFSLPSSLLHRSLMSLHALGRCSAPASSSCVCLALVLRTTVGPAFR
jgi:hypothetical protein